MSVDRRDRPRACALAMLAFVALVGVTSAASIASPGQNIVVQNVLSLVRVDRTILAATVAGLALGAGFLLAALPLFKGKAAAIAFSFAVAIGALTTVSLKPVISQFLPTPRQISDDVNSILGDAGTGYRTQLLTNLDLFPTAIATDEDGNIFVAGYVGKAYRNGAVIRVDEQDDGTAEIRTVATYLNRPHGLAIKNGDLYVSRSGQFSRAAHGRITQENTGAVTRLRDLDDDGTFEYYDDVVSDLPGAHEPDGLHQNNGIAFGPDGLLYITVGAPSDHGPSSHQFAGTILVYDSSSDQIRVFARGFRNPYGIAVGPKGQVFCTDNDSSFGTGDKLVHVKEGHHYGHPYDATELEFNLKGVAKPILRFANANAQGICVAPSPSEDTVVLLVASYSDNAIYRVVLTKHKDLFSAEKQFLATISRPVAIAISEDGTIYACSHEGHSLYRISPPE